MGVTYKWDNKNKMKFTEALKNCDIINDISQRIEAGLIDITGEKIQKMFVDAANISLDRNKNSRKKSKKVKKSKKWVDNNCYVLKCKVDVVGKQKHANPHNNLLKMKYHEKLKEYKRECKSRRYNFWQNKFKDI